MGNYSENSGGYRIALHIAGKDERLGMDNIMMYIDTPGTTEEFEEMWTENVLNLFRIATRGESTIDKYIRTVTQSLSAKDLAGYRGYILGVVVTLTLRPQQQ